MPINPPQNFTINLPTVTMTVNAAEVWVIADEAQADAASLIVTLRVPFGGYPAGTVVVINPVHADVAPTFT